MAARPSSPTDAEPAPAEPGSRLSVMMLAAGALLLLVVSLTGGNDKPSDAPRRPHAARGAASASPAGDRTGKHLPRSRPLRLLIPKISVSAPFTDLAIGPKGRLEPPPAADTNLVGWHAGEASPGEAGTAIIADDFPSERVYADTARAQVRLITCAGDYDRTARDYTENLMVFAHLT